MLNSENVSWTIFSWYDHHLSACLGTCKKCAVSTSFFIILNVSRQIQWCFGHVNLLWPWAVSVIYTQNRLILLRCHSLTFSVTICDEQVYIFRHVNKVFAPWGVWLMMNHSMTKQTNTNEAQILCQTKSSSFIIHINATLAFHISNVILFSPITLFLRVVVSFRQRFECSSVYNNIVSILLERQCKFGFANTDFKWIKLATINVFKSQYLLWTLTLMENKFHVLGRGLKFKQFRQLKQWMQTKFISVDPSTLSVAPKVHKLRRFMHSESDMVQNI